MGGAPRRIQVHSHAPREAGRSAGGGRPRSDLVRASGVSAGGGPGLASGWLVGRCLDHASCARGVVKSAAIRVLALFKLAEVQNKVTAQKRLLVRNHF